MLEPLTSAHILLARAQSCGHTARVGNGFSALETKDLLLHQLRVAGWAYQGASGPWGHHLPSLSSAIHCSLLTLACTSARILSHMISIGDT